MISPPALHRLQMRVSGNHPLRQARFHEKQGRVRTTACVTLRPHSASLVLRFSGTREWRSVLICHSESVDLGVGGDAGLRVVLGPGAEKR